MSYLKMIMLNFLRFVSILAFFSFSSCAYQLGVKERKVPGDVKKIAITLFKNYSQEVGAEIYFTNALASEFQRSKIASVVEEPLSDALLTGKITRIEYVAPETSLKLAKDSLYLPQGTVLATVYNVNITVDVSLLRRGDNKVLWAGSFSGVRSYSAPQVTLPVVNSVNPLYNLSARRQNIELIANDVMSEVHDRMTENF